MENEWIKLYHAWRFAPGAQLYFLSCVEHEADMEKTYEDVEVGLCTVTWLCA